MSTLNENTLGDFNRSLVNEYRENGGKVSGMFAGVPMLLLTTIGAKSGKARVSPLIYTVDGERLVVIASKGGADTHPDWYYNLVAHPVATVEVGSEIRQVWAREVGEDERDRLYARMVEVWPGFAEYERMTTRRIPVLVLEGVGGREWTEPLSPDQLSSR